MAYDALVWHGRRLTAMLDSLAAVHLDKDIASDYKRVAVTVRHAVKTGSAAFVADTLDRTHDVLKVVVDLESPTTRGLVLVKVEDLRKACR